MKRRGGYYEGGEGRAKRVEDLFSKIAPRYDLINDLQSAGLHRVWKRRLVRLAAVPDGGAVLDLCCGTGDIVRALARTYPRAALVAGLDFSMPMLRIAARRSAGQGLVRYAPGDVPDEGVPGDPARAGSGLAPPGIDPEVGWPSPRPQVALLAADALRIPARDGSFDRVTISYGLRNLRDIPTCLAEVRRVLRSEGRLLVLDFGKPANPIVSRVYFACLRAVVPGFGKLFFGDRETYAYIYDSLLRFPSQDELATELGASGFARVRVERPLFGIMGIHVAEP